jgi:hypothetical protein
VIRRIIDQYREGKIAVSSLQNFFIIAVAIMIIGVGILFSIPTPPPAQTFVAADFIWDEQLSPHKDGIIARVNEIHRKVNGCQDIDPTSAYLSDKSTPGKPVFFVTCGSGVNIFNVWFSRDGILSGPPRS